MVTRMQHYCMILQTLRNRLRLEMTAYQISKGYIFNINEDTTPVIIPTDGGDNTQHYSAIKVICPRK